MRRAGCLVLTAALTVVGCASSPEPDFYALSPMGGQALSSTELRVEVRRPTAPSYLDRPELVTRTSSEELALDETAHWAAPLAEMVGRTLAENLAARLPRAAVYTEGFGGGQAPDLVIDVRALAFRNRAGFRDEARRDRRFGLGVHSRTRDDRALHAERSRRDDGRRPGARAQRDARPARRCGCTAGSGRPGRWASRRGGSFRRLTRHRPSSRRHESCAYRALETDSDRCNPRSSSPSASC